MKKIETDELISTRLPDFIDFISNHPRKISIFSFYLQDYIKKATNELSQLESKLDQIYVKSSAFLTLAGVISLSNFTSQVTLFPRSIFLIYVLPFLIIGIVFFVLISYRWEREIDTDLEIPIGTKFDKIIYLLIEAKKLSYDLVQSAKEHKIDRFYSLMMLVYISEFIFSFFLHFLIVGLYGTTLSAQQEGLNFLLLFGIVPILITMLVTETEIRHLNKMIDIYQL